MSEEIVKRDLAFEQELFADGRYRFDREAEIRESELVISRYQSRLTRNTLEYFVNNQRHGLAWKRFFDGLIPRRWGESWASVGNDFEEAGRRNVQLNEVLVDAGVSHANNLVVNTAGVNQRLTIEQLSVVMARDDIPDWNLDEIVEAQRSKGMSNRELGEAEEIAKEMRAGFEEARKQGEERSLPIFGDY